MVPVLQFLRLPPEHQASTHGWGRGGPGCCCCPEHHPVKGPVLVPCPTSDVADSFLFQRCRVWSLHEPCQSLWASSGGQLLGLSLGLLGRAHDRCPPCQRAGEVGDAAVVKREELCRMRPPISTCPPPQGLCPAPCNQPLFHGGIQGLEIPSPSPSHEDRATST